MTVGEKGEAAAETPATPSEPKRGVGVVGDLEEAPDDGEVTPMIPVAQPSLTPTQTPQTIAQPTVLPSMEMQVLPRIRMLARELRVDLNFVKGTGPNNTITETDVRNYAAQGGAQASGQTQSATPAQAASASTTSGIKIEKKYDLYGHVKRVPYTGLRKTIGDYMVQSATTTVQVTHHDMVDVTKLWELRANQKKSAEDQGIKLNFLPYIVKATSAALQAYPVMNSTLHDDEGEIIIKEYFNIGIAVATDDGLMVPVIKVADSKDIFTIAKEIQELGEKARTRKINMGEMKGGSFTITNYGSIGGMFATPIINYPEAAILGIGKIKDMPAVIDGQVAVRKMMGISVSYDHRIIDGATTAAFMNKIIEGLENPEGLK